MDRAKNKGGRPKTGTLVKTRGGLWQAIVTLADGSRMRLEPFPAGTSEAMAREKAAFWAEQLTVAKPIHANRLAAVTGITAKQRAVLSWYGLPLSASGNDPELRSELCDLLFNNVHRKTQHGYVVLCTAKQPFVHRLVMSLSLGRDLFKTENVHHKNGARADNSIENLELWSKSQPAGQRVADKVSWAKDLLQHYQGML